MVAGVAMPCIARFDGISIYVFADDHAPPHVHAFKGGRKAKYEIESARLLAGQLDVSADRAVRRWMRRRRDQLARAWAAVASHEQHVPKVDPP